MKDNTSILFSSQIYDYKALNTLYLQITAVLEALTAIQSDTINSDFFIRKFGEHKFFNSCAGMRKWKRSDKAKKVIKGVTHDVKTDAYAIDEENR